VHRTGAASQISRASGPRAAWDHPGDVEISVVHLAWAGAGPEALRRFVASYDAHPAGLEHRLVVAWKGRRDPDAVDRGRDLLSTVAHEEIEVSPEGLDLRSYREAAGRVRGDAVCFLNSSSVILADGWLAGLAGNLSPAGVGLVGATGSYESPLSGAPLPLRLLRTGRFPPFPNPHVRTNAFMLDRALMLDLWWPPVSSKRAAWELESGNRSVTRQIEARGLAALVVDRDGNGYPRERWFESRTFRSEQQQNLLVADNRTRQFAEAEPRLRRKLIRLAWGEAPAGAALRAIEASAG
jgi:hypothetical protein